MDQMEENELELEAVVDETNICDYESIVINEKPETSLVEEKTEKLVRFPLARVKHLVKQDPDTHLCSQEALFIITKSTELFIECLTKEAYLYTSQAKKKTVQKRDVDQAIDSVDALAFLEGVLDS